MTKKQEQIIQLLKSAGQEGAEDMLVATGMAKNHGAARAQITKAIKAMPIA